MFFFFGFLAAATRPVGSCGIFVLRPGIKPTPLRWKCRVPAIGLQGNFHYVSFFILPSPLPHQNAAFENVSSLSYFILLSITALCPQQVFLALSCVQVTSTYKSKHFSANEFGSWIGKISWRRERLHTPVCWPREFQGQYGLWGCKESDITKHLSLSLPLLRVGVTEQ